MGRRRKYKHDNDPPYFRLARELLYECKEWKELSPAAKLLYMYIKARYNGSNNGKIKVPYGDLKGSKGLSSPKTFSNAQKELIDKEWIIKTEYGGMFRYSNLYELTWKYDILQ